MFKALLALRRCLTTGASNLREALNPDGVLEGVRNQ